MYDPHSGVIRVDRSQQQTKREITTTDETRGVFTQIHCETPSSVISNRRNEGCVSTTHQPDSELVVRLRLQVVGIRLDLAGANELVVIVDQIHRAVIDPDCQFV